MHVSGTVLLVVDVQTDVISDCFDGETILGRIDELVLRARHADVPIVWVQHSGPGLPRESVGWEVAEPLMPSPNEPVVHKTYGDAFEDTTLGEILTRLEADSLVVVGCETDACIRSTIHGAFTRGYSVTLVGDAHTTSDKTEWGAPAPEQVVAHTNLYWQFQNAPGRQAAVIDSAGLPF